MPDELDTHPGLYMVMIPEDFEPEAEDRSYPPKQSVTQVAEEPLVTAPTRRDLVGHEYPEWTDDIPPWRNPNPKGPTYLFVHQQHAARCRGHH